jgi:polar amino acid transport system substrate-binding protein
LTLTQTVAIAVLLMSCGRVPEDDALGRLRARGTLRWGGDLQGGEPYVFQDPEDASRLVGFEVEIADSLARRLGVRAEFVQNDWQTLVPSLERGDFDVALNGIEVTPARRARVAFTRPYYAFTETLVVPRADGRVRALADLRGAPRRDARGLAGGRPGARGAQRGDRAVRGVEEPYLDLERGRLAGVLLDNIIAARYGLPRATLRAAATVGEGTYAIALRPDQPELLRAVDDALAGLTADGELRRILERWHLWDDGRTAIGARRSRGPAPPARALAVATAALPPRCAAFTIVISRLAMALAVAGGLVAQHRAALRRARRPVRRGVRRALPRHAGAAPALRPLLRARAGLTLDAFTAAVVGLGLNYAAYESELYRAGSTPSRAGRRRRRSRSACRAATLRRIVLPQALRVALPGSRTTSSRS